MRTTKETTCNTASGVLTFHVTQLGGVRAGKTLIRILPLIPQLLTLLPKDFKLSELKNPEAIRAKLFTLDLSLIDFKAIGEVLANLTPDEFEHVTNALLGDAFAIGRDPNTGEEFRATLTPGQLDQLFAGHVWDLFRLVGFALSLNYFTFSPAPGASKLSPPK